MDWDHVQKQKQELMRSVVAELDEPERNLLSWLLNEERKNRSKSSWGYTKPMRDLLRALVADR